MNVAGMVISSWTRNATAIRFKTLQEKPIWAARFFLSE
jgi:hypothetical protein